MDNALIDDRRIHVDFSQSVSKLWNKYRRKEHLGAGKGRDIMICGFCTFYFDGFLQSARLVVN